VARGKRCSENCPRKKISPLTVPLWETLGCSSCQELSVLSTDSCLNDPDGHEVSLYWASAKRLQKTNSQKFSSPLALSGPWQTSVHASLLPARQRGLAVARA
jgi:hypothetical protein